MGATSDRLAAASVLPAAAIVPGAAGLEGATVAFFASLGGRAAERPAPLRPLAAIERGAAAFLAPLGFAPLRTVVLTARHIASTGTATRCDGRGGFRQPQGGATCDRA